MPRNRGKIQEALRQRKENDAILNQARAEERAYQCFFQPDALPAPLECGTVRSLKVTELRGFPSHETHFPLYTGERLDDMIESIRRYGVQTPILAWKTKQRKYVIISGHNRVNAAILAGLDTVPAVVRSDLTKETAEELFFEMNFRQRSLADMVFSQRVLCVAAHYNIIKRQGRRTDLQAISSTFPDTQEKFIAELGATFPDTQEKSIAELATTSPDTQEKSIAELATTSPDTQEKSVAELGTTFPDTQEKSHADTRIAQEYELTRDKVSKYCRYATMYRPLLLLMDHKKLGQLAAYEVSFVTERSLQKLICQIVTENKINLSVAKAKQLRETFEAGKLSEAGVMDLLSKRPRGAGGANGRRISITIPPDFAAYFPEKPSAKQIEETVRKALALYFRMEQGTS